MDKDSALTEAQIKIAKLSKVRTLAEYEKVVWLHLHMFPLFVIQGSGTSRSGSDREAQAAHEQAEGCRRRKRNLEKRGALLKANGDIYCIR